MANQAFFTRIYLDADDTIRTEPTPSFGLLLDPGTQQQALSWADPQRQAGKRPTQTLIHHVEGSSKTRGVDLESRNKNRLTAAITQEYGNLSGPMGHVGPLRLP